MYSLVRFFVAQSTPIAAVAVAVVNLSCIGHGLMTDGTSVSVGRHSFGTLRNATRLPVRGRSWSMPQRWRDRARNFGTDELVGLLVRSARWVRSKHRGSVLGIADLSPRSGGPTAEHLSHHSGRDVDLLFYAVDQRGRTVTPETMVAFNKKGKSVPPKKNAGCSTNPDAGAAGAAGGVAKGKAEPPPVLRFDVRRNWALIRAMITDPEVPVQWVFIGRPLIRLLLDYARRIKEPQWLIRRAALLMHQPGDAQNHMDHMHVRIFCPPSDRYQGCVDAGPPRWLKKTIKYTDQPSWVRIPRVLSKLAFHPCRQRLLRLR